MSRALRLNVNGSGSELAQNHPLLSSLEAKALIKGAGRRMFSCYTTKSSARTGIAARRDEIFFFFRLPTSLQFRQHAGRRALNGESSNCA